MKNTEHMNKQNPPFYTKNELIIFWEKLVLLGEESSKCADVFWGGTTTSTNKSWHIIAWRIPRNELSFYVFVPERCIRWVIFCISEVGIHSSHTMPVLGCTKKRNKLFY